MGLDKLLSQAEEHEFAMISEFELTTADLFCIMSELHSPEMKEHRADIRKRFHVKSDDNSANVFDFFALKREFVENWFKQEYTVTYQDVPLRLLKENRTNI